MKIIEYWIVTTEYDRSSTIIGYFANESVAQDVQGTDMYRSVSGPHIIKVFDTVEEFEDNSRARIRERALAKLTTDEKIALGVK